MDLEKQTTQEQRPDGDPIEQRRCNLETYSSIPEQQAQKDGNGNGKAEEQQLPRRQDDGNSDSDGEDLNRNTSMLERVVSRVTSRSFAADPGPPPDGGFRAWAMCLSGHFVIMNTWGMINSFGVFQTYYATILPGRPPSDISWIGSITVFLLFFLGSFTGRLTDAGLFRPIFLLGSALQITGIVTTSFCTSYYQFLLAQGVCLGLGCGFLFCPCLALISTYFLRRRAIALGLAACGSVTGGLVFPVMVRQLLPQIGFPWTIRAIALIQLATLVAANLLSRPRVKPRKTGPLIELSAFKEPEYAFYASAAFFFFLGVYFAFYYLVAFSREGLADPFSFEESLNLLLILNGIGAIGRLAPNYIADRVGAINVFIPVCVLASTLVFCWIAVKDATGLYIWSAFYGIGAAGIQSLFPAALSFLTTDLQKIGVRMGMVFSIVAFAVLLGPPIAGVIIDRSGGYAAAQAFSGACLALGCFFLICCKVARMRRNKEGWRCKI